MINSAQAANELISLQYPFPAVRRNLNWKQRAAQFKPFDALDGYSEAVNETFRETQAQEPELDEDTAQRLTRRFSFLLDRISDHPEVTIIWFEPDQTKAGGSFRQAKGKLLKYDSSSRKVMLSGGLQISLFTMFGIKADFFDNYDI